MASYKQYMRGQRSLITEEQYQGGINYTSAPLNTGNSRMQANFDYKDNGEILIPRPGFRAIEYARKKLAGSTGIALGTDVANRIIIGGVECTEGTDRYRQVVIGDAVSKHLHVQTIPLASTGDTFNTDIPLLNYREEPLANTPYTTTFNTPASGTIHGMTATTPALLAKHVGVFAFNNSYYYFKNGDLMHTVFDEASKYYKGEAITPRDVSTKEAVAWGYNMLKANPFTFSNTLDTTARVISLEGILPYNLAGNIELSPQVNQTLNLECFFSATTTRVYTFVWEWRDPSAATWITLKTEDLTITAGVTRAVCEFSSPGKNIMVKVTATNKADANDLKVMVVGLNFDKSDKGAASNAKLMSYPLQNATTMAYWRNRLVLGYQNCVFFSDINDPSYFPYPQNMHPLDETIVHMVPLLDTLLVFTTSKLYAFTLNVDAMSWTVKCIQGHLDIKTSDIHLIQVVKNMVFFKSGNYYYMVVPVSSTQTTMTLTVAPISKNLELFFNNFQSAMAELFEMLYYYRDEFSLVTYYDFLDFEDVHVNYVFTTTKNVYINVSLLYNIVSRTWRAYVFESGTVVNVFQSDVTKKGTYMAFVAGLTDPCLQFMQYNQTNNKDMYISFATETTDVDGNITSTLPNTVFKNYQLIDTGYREQNSDFKKRYREAQLKFNNVSQEQLYFYTAFYIDGDERKTMVKYDVSQITDPGDPNFGLIYLSRTLVDPDIIPGATILAETDTDTNCWMLDVSRFPEIHFWKVRIPISGKGYAPRMIFVSYNEKAFELLNNSWVARQLNAR